MALDERNDTSTDEGTSSPADALYYGTASEAIARYTHCTICGGNLHFTHVTDFIRNITQETARCPECGLKIRRVVHRLQ